MDIYSIKNELLSSNIDNFLDNADLLAETKEIYSNVKNLYLDPITWNGESNEENCLKMEQNYLTYLSVLNNYMGSCFKYNNFSKTSIYLEKMSQEYKMKFENLLQDLKNDDIYIDPDL